MRYRRKGITKRQHGMIKGLSSLLQKIEDWPEVQSIIPGRIEKARSSGKVRLRVNYITKSGLKVIARGERAAQEVFFVTDDPELLSEKLKKLI